MAFDIMAIALAIALAVTTGHFAVADVLLDAGASPNRADALGTTPLHIVQSQRGHGYTGRLLGAGALPNFRNAWGLTPLDIAEREELASVHELRHAGARPGNEVRMRDVLAELSADDRSAYAIPRAWGMPPDDPALVAAKDRAQAERDRAIQAVADGRPVRVKFVVREQPEHAGESVWGAVRACDGDSLAVELLSEPASVRVDDALSIHLDDLVDWEIETPDGRLLGGYTARATFDRVEAEFGEVPEWVAAQRAAYVHP